MSKLVEGSPEPTIDLVAEQKEQEAFDEPCFPDFGEPDPPCFPDLGPCDPDYEPSTCPLDYLDPDPYPEPN